MHYSYLDEEDEAEESVQSFEDTCSPNSKMSFELESPASSNFAKQNAKRSFSPKEKSNASNASEQYGKETQKTSTYNPQGFKEPIIANTAISSSSLSRDIACNFCMRRIPKTEIASHMKQCDLRMESCPHGTSTMTALTVFRQFHRTMCDPVKYEGLILPMAL